jgi:uncharacterized membrane protein AbrB (regulator of aidB expression)
VFLIAASVGCVQLLSYMTDDSVVRLLLAYSPGGLTETSLMAIALHVDVAFVATHHVLRVFFVTVAATLVARLLDRTDTAPQPPD